MSIKTNNKSSFSSLSHTLRQGVGNREQEEVYQLPITNHPLPINLYILTTTI
ncbi:hypothetical protein Anacy_2520 [Anabaena cylindrica PCC 7122]|uniref:Uncharacterized protein n=1 Tax=Anabaena cylindrica (strain ATCC 27899 / PCC 7122) TaxID=272123 RepID=K9ZHZ0_ANACC|nr:hypothetical protein Anacy_2520 [Anabaena cylindrica PCC 7122]BAY05071.1 hypothetical protein NIES19_43400 [Anabaena cylindrica PCC 7122]